MVRHEPADLLCAFSRASDAVFAVDQRMRVVYWNTSAERAFGVDEAAAIGRRCDDLIGGYETSGAVLCGPSCRVIECARRGHAAETHDLVRTNVGGKPQRLNVSIVVLRGRRRASTLTVHLVRDVTAQRGVEERAGALFHKLRGADVAFDLPPITRREADVLRMLACGASNEAIAASLGISATTVRNHVEHLLAKLSVHSKLEAVVFAAQHGLV